MMRARGLLSSVLAAYVVLFVLGYAYGVENILKNGGFESGAFDPWSEYGDVQVEVVGKEADPVEGNYCLHVVTHKGENFWDAGIQYGDVVFKKGKKYTLAAFLKASKPLNINFKPELAQDPWTGYGEQQFEMSQEWKEYHITTPVFDSDVSPASITFHVAFDEGEFWMDAVRFFEGNYVEPEFLKKPSSLRPGGKLPTTWGGIKAR